MIETARVIQARLLADEFVLHCATPALADALSTIPSRAAQDDIPLRARHDWQISGEAGAHLLRDAGGDVAQAGTIEALRNLVLARMAETVFAAWPDHGQVLAALGRHDGRAFLLIGGPRSGRTVLALALLQAGIEMVGDHLALVAGGRAMAYPRPFGYWETAAALLPGLPPPAVQPPALQPPVGVGRQHQIDIEPTDFGQPWRIGADPIGWIFCLDPNFYGRSLLRRCSPAEALHYILPNCRPPAAGGPLWAARFYGLLDQVQPAILTLGTPETAVAWIRRALAGAASAERRTA